ncbi:MAG: hypothetical protein AAGU76_00600 [Sedimentibacter sp.]|uniref:hypothetical protein n=1 Tax=Sedimentibacter sp. TaxID=1960295 RepID=UPI003158C712
MKINIRSMAFIIFIVIFGGIAVTIAAGVWSTESDKIPATYKEGEFAGQYNPEDIRGSYTFSDVSRLFEVESEVLYRAFGLEGLGEREIQTKELESLYADLENEIGNGSVQVFVALYKNLPIALEDTYLPKQAADIIIEYNNNLTDEQLEYLLEHVVELPKISQDEAGEQKTEEEDISEEENLVNGKTTFQQVLDAGIAKEQIEEILGRKIPPSNMSIKDFCLDEGLSFSEIKAKLNELAP